jgi:hypothetical protein
MVMVEVAGIEPASFDASVGLLRAQCGVSLLGPAGHPHKPAVTGPVAVSCPVLTRDRRGR